MIVLRDVGCVDEGLVEFRVFHPKANDGSDRFATVVAYHDRSAGCNDCAREIERLLSS